MKGRIATVAGAAYRMPSRKSAIWTFVTIRRFAHASHAQFSMLMPCKWTTSLASRWTYGSRSARLHCRLYASRARTLKGDDFGPTRVDGHHTMRLRKDGKGKELPLPPRLDPVILEQQYQWKTPKAQPNHAELSPFQRKLQANVYGIHFTDFVLDILLSDYSAFSSISSTEVSRTVNRAPRRSTYRAPRPPKC